MIDFHHISQATSVALASAGLDPHDVAELVRATVLEDLDGGIDVTSTATVSADQRSTGTFGARAHGRLSGIVVAAAVVETVCGAAASSFQILVPDGSAVSPGDVLARVEAPTRLLLTAERTALNLLCHLSGVATATAVWADALAGTGAVVRDTRKTTPGLRALEKYAVRCGGGQNHRMSLSDAALVKDNHIVAAGGVDAAFSKVRQFAPGIPIEIEVDTVEQLRVAIAAGADVVLLDNMDDATLHQAVAVARQHKEQTGRDVILEASGGLTLARARSVAETGVHFISVGAITHSAPVLDIGLDLTAVL